MAAVVCSLLVNKGRRHHISCVCTIYGRDGHLCTHNLWPSRHAMPMHLQAFDKVHCHKLTNTPSRCKSAWYSLSSCRRASKFTFSCLLLCVASTKGIACKLPVPQCVHFCRGPLVHVRPL